MGLFRYNGAIWVRVCPDDDEMLLLLRAKADGKHTSPDIIERDMYGENATPWILFKEDNRGKQK
jgi:hypothetical protein